MYMWLYILYKYIYMLIIYIQKFFKKLIHLREKIRNTWKNLEGGMWKENDIIIISKIKEML